MAHASESGHWYDREGNPVYEVKAKNGNMRPATLADARKMNLVPGVSGVIACAAKPGLERWKVNQAVLAAMTLPRRPNEDDAVFIERVLRDSQEQARKAAERGTAIHAAIQGHYEGEPPAEEHWLFVRGADIALSKWMKGPWTPEKSFAHRLGFGGKADLHSPWAVVDFKSKEFDDPTKKLAWDEHCIQLAAYREGLGYHRAKCANVFVSTTQPGLVHLHEWDEEELKRGWARFHALLNYWKADRAYESGWDYERIGA